MARGSDIAARLDAEHTVAREQQILDAVMAGEIVPIEWVDVPVSHVFSDKTIIRGTVTVAKHALRLGDERDNFRPNTNHITAQRIADALEHIAAAKAPEGVVLPTAKIMDFAFRAATLKIDPCIQSPDATMGNTKRMLEHSRCVTRSIAGRDGLTTTEGKAWANTNRLIGHPELEANYGLYADGAIHQSVLGYKLWQPGPSIRHLSGFNAPKVPQGYTDYSEVLERLVLRTMYVEGRGMMDILDVAKDGRLSWLISSEGPIIMRHPAVPDPDATIQPPAPIAAPLAIFTRTLRLRSPAMTGEDVAFVQGIVGARADRIFGPKTEAAVKSWQRQHIDPKTGAALTVDGIVGPRTQASMLAAIGAGAVAMPPLPPVFVPEGYDPHKASYKEARYYNRQVLRDMVHWLTMHSAEAAELPTTAEALQGYFHTMPDGRVASAHWCFDSDSGARSVPEDRIAYHAKSLNRYGVGYEHAGFARQSRAEWLDEYGESMLTISATTAAKISGPRWGLPLDNFVDAEGLRKAKALIDAGKPVPNELRGVTTHWESTKAFGVDNHTDPGKYFPMDWYMNAMKLVA